MTETRPTRILVIDDEATQRMLVKEYLEEAGYQVRLSESGEHGLKLANAVAPDLIIVDALLPSLDGYTVCSTIRERPKTADIPVILMTASKEANAIAKGLAAGATDFITKPVEWRFLADRVAYVLEKSKSMRQLHAEKFFVEQELRLTHEKEEQQLQRTESELERATAALVEEARLARTEVESGKAAHEQEVRAIRAAAASEIQGAREAAAQDARSLWSFVSTINSEQLGLVRSILHKAEDAMGCLGEPAGSDLQEHLAALHTQAKALIGLSHNVNIFAQSLSAKAPLVESEFDPEVQIGIIMARVGAACAERGLSIRASVASDCPRLFADELKIGFVLLNALSNAIRFTPVGGTLSFKIGLETDGWLAIALSDNGVGMPPAVVERLRGCLEQPGQIAGSSGGPIGLGLPIAMSIARLHGGRLEIESSVGHGTTVSLRMPPERLRRTEGTAPGERKSA